MRRPEYPCDNCDHKGEECQQGCVDHAVYTIAFEAFKAYDMKEYKIRQEIFEATGTLYDRRRKKIKNYYRRRK